MHLSGRTGILKLFSFNRFFDIKIINNLIVPTLLTVIFLLSACSSENNKPSEPGNDECPAEQWDYDTGGYYAYSHDCNPYIGDHFTVFSDGSSVNAKRQLAEMTEEIFNNMLFEFQIYSIWTELQFLPGYTYYIYAQKHIEDIKIMGYRNGFFVAAIDCATIPDAYSRNPAFYKYLIKHELTHVFQFTLTDCPRNADCPYWLGVWFREGQAVYMGKHPTGIITDSMEEFQEWIADLAHINPILIHRWSDFPNPDIGGQFYPMFGLAYQYLIDTDHGHGATINDMRKMFQLMKEGDGFKEAFSKALNISVSWYQENFYALMEEYLSKLGNEKAFTGLVKH
ncbi:hypothetical protein ACFLS9_00910 [Bacteroidota bacterium]